MSSRNYSDEKINDIFNKQLSEGAYRDLSTHILVNDTTKDDVLRQMRDILDCR